MNDRKHQLTLVTIIGSVVNVLLTVGKLVAGFFGHSAAMIADGLHSLTDLISDVIVFFCVRIAVKGRDEDHEYGHGKYETLATLCVSLLLLAVGIKLFWSGLSEVLYHLRGGIIPPPRMIALWAALVSIVSKEALYQYTVLVGRRTVSPVVIANAWHHRTDALSSIGSALGIGGAIVLGQRWTILDPLACCAISIFIIVIALKMSMPALRELLEVSLPKEMENEIILTAREVEGLDNIHNLKTRQNGPYIIIEAHIVVSPTMTVADAHDIATEIERRLRARFGAETQIALHLEPSVDAE